MSKVHMACLNPQVNQSWVIILWKYLTLVIPPTELLNKFLLDKKKKETQKERKRKGGAIEE